MIKFFKKLKDRYNQSVVLNEFLAETRDLDEVLVDKRLEIFKEKVTPLFAKIGLTNWDGKYIWFSDFNEYGIKHVIEYNVFKHYGGSFSYGNCFYSVPTISGGKRLINHRTDKSTKIHFFKRIDKWQESMDTNSRDRSYMLSTVNEIKFRRSIDNVLAENLSKIQNWFDKMKSLEENIEGLKYDLEHPTFSIGQRIISTEYILSFLYKEKGEIELAESFMDKHLIKDLNNNVERELLIKRVKG
jgi:hypothetical protein